MFWNYPEIDIKNGSFGERLEFRRKAFVERGLEFEFYHCMFNGSAWVYSYPQCANRFVSPIYPSAKIIRQKVILKKESEHLESLGYLLEECKVVDSLSKEDWRKTC